MFLLLAFVFARVVAHAAPPQSSLVAAPGPAEIYAEAVNALYNLDFERAEQNFSTLTKIDEDNPSYWNHLSSTQWLRILHDQQKLSLESFSGSGEFGTQESKDALTAQSEERLRKTIQTAISRADVLLKRNPSDIQALYAQGVSYATLASFEATAKRSYLAAHKAARRAKDLHEKVLKLDPNFNDARLAVGMYDYVMGVIPGWARFLLGFVGVYGGGNKERGIQQLETAARLGKLVPTDAKMLLVIVYNRERLFDKSLALLQELHRIYPRNYMFHMALADIFRKQKKLDQAVAVYEDVIAQANAERNGYERLGTAKPLLALGRTNIDRYQFDAAATAYRRVVVLTSATDDEKGNAHLWLGKMLDSSKRRGEALKEYDAVLALRCAPDIKGEAAKYKKRPFGT